MKYDAYALKGRILPALFSIILPIMIFNHFYISEELSKFIGEVFGAELIANLTISGICLYYLSEAGRVLGKNIFENNYFKNESHMPTTNYLMHSDNSYSEQYKKMIREKINTDFGITLPTISDEVNNNEISRTRIVETMALVRKKLHHNKFLLQHNIEYGAMRNAIGGSVLGIIFSFVNIAFFNFYVLVDLATKISIATLFVYLIFIIFSKYIMNFYANNYAKILFREYMA